MNKEEQQTFSETSRTEASFEHVEISLNPWQVEMFATSLQGLARKYGIETDYISSNTELDGARCYSAASTDPESNLYTISSLRNGIVVASISSTIRPELRNPSSIDRVGPTERFILYPDGRVDYRKRTEPATDTEPEREPDVEAIFTKFMNRFETAKKYMNPVAQFTSTAGRLLTGRIFRER